MDYYKGLTIFFTILLVISILLVPLKYLLKKENLHSIQSVIVFGIIFFIGFFGIIFGLMALAYFYPKYQRKIFRNETYIGLDKDNF